MRRLRLFFPKGGVSFSSCLMSCLCLIFMLSSCIHKMISDEDDHAVHLKVSFNWSKSPGACPRSMAVFFYSLTDNKMLRHDFRGCSGGVIRLPRDSYRALCFNTNTEGMIYKNTHSFEDFVITTRETRILSSLLPLVTRGKVPRAENTDDERVALSAHKIWSDKVMMIHAGTMEENFVRAQGDEQEVVFHPQARTRHYTVEVKNIQNMKYNTGFSATLSTISGGYLPGADKLSDELVTVPFEMSSNLEEKAITGSFDTFGCNDIAGSKHYLTVYAVLSDGRQWFYKADVTDQIHEAGDSEHITIVIENLRLPKPIVNGGGFKPELSEWKEIDEYIKM